MIEYKRIEAKDSEKITNLRKEVLENLERPEFFVQDTNEMYKKQFDTTVPYGAYEEAELVGMTKLYITEEEYLEEYKELLGFHGYKICELGSAIVKKEYRNQGIMQRLIKDQIQIAKDLKFDYIVATVHPENIPSSKAFEKNGFKVEKTGIIEEKYLRNFYVFRIDK